MYGQDDYDATFLEQDCDYSLPTLFAYHYWDMNGGKDAIQDKIDKHDEQDECKNNKCPVCLMNEITEIIDKRGLSIQEESFASLEERTAFINGYMSALNEFQDYDDSKHKNVILLTLEELEESVLHIKSQLQ